MTRKPLGTPSDQAGSWRPGDAQLGWIIENRLDEAYLLSWPAELETYIPLHGTGGFGWTPYSVPTREVASIFRRTLHATARRLAA